MESAANLHLVERLTRVAPDTINYEFACHEENHSMLGILAGARAEEKAAEEAAKKGAK